MELEHIIQPISKELLKVSKEMTIQLNKICEKQTPAFLDKQYVNQTIRHLFKVSGKFLRPALVLLSAKAVNKIETPDDDSLIKLATAVELIHSASLIHDDIIDESEYRRKQLSLNKEFCNQTAVLVGDILYSQFFSILINLETVSCEQRIMLLEILSTTTRRMCLGEILEQQIKNYNTRPTLQEYLEIIENKTASLMSACCLSGAAINGADEKFSRALANYGLCLGSSFQISDDCIDDDSLYNSKKDLIEKAKEYSCLAKEEIAVLEQSPAKQSLLNLSEYVIGRIKE